MGPCYGPLLWALNVPILYNLDITGIYTEQATTRVRQLAQIYNIYASASALPTCLSQIFDTNFPQANLTMKPTNQDYKSHETKKTRKPKKKKKKTRLQDPWNQKNKKKKKKKKQDCKTHESSNLGTLGSDILVFLVFLFFPHLSGEGC